MRSHACLSGAELSVSCSKRSQSSSVALSEKSRILVKSVYKGLSQVVGRNLCGFASIVARLLIIMIIVSDSSVFSTIQKYQNKNGVPTGVFLGVFDKDSIEVVKCFSISKLAKIW